MAADATPGEQVANYKASGSLEVIGGELQIAAAGKITAAGTQAAHIAALTDNSGGAASNTLAVINLPDAMTDNSGGSASTTIASISDGATKDAVASILVELGKNKSALATLQAHVASLAAKINALNTAVQGVGITAAS